MRTTIDLPDDIHRLATAWARHQGSTLSHAVSDLIQRGLEQRPLNDKDLPFQIDPLTSLPVVRSSRLITADDVVAIEDEGR